MEEKLQSILNEYSEYIERYKTDKEGLIAKLEFCNTHKLLEEERITKVKYHAINMIIYNWELMHDEIQDLLNKWNS